MREQELALEVAPAGKERARQSFRLRLLALVLAGLLVWYTINPAPARAAGRIKREEDEPGEKERSVGPGVGRAGIFPSALGALAVGQDDSPFAYEEEDDDWPEYIDG